MAASTLDLETAFEGRAAQIGIEDHYVEKFVEKKFAAFGCCAFAAVYSPNRTDEVPPRRFLNDLLVEDPSSDQLACMRRLFFESHTMALTDAHQRAEASPDPLLATRRLATAQCVATQKDQETRLGGLVFTPETTPSNHLVGLFVDMRESGALAYIKPEPCCSTAQEVSAVRKDTAGSTDATGLLKLGTKASGPTCEANTELKLRAAWQHHNLAMDLAGEALQYPMPLPSVKTHEATADLERYKRLRSPLTKVGQMDLAKLATAPNCSCLMVAPLTMMRIVLRGFPSRLASANSRAQQASDVRVAITSATRRGAIGLDLHPH